MAEPVFSNVTRWLSLVRLIVNLVMPVWGELRSHPVAFSVPFMHGIGVTQRREQRSDTEFGAPLLQLSSLPGPTFTPHGVSIPVAFPGLLGTERAGLILASWPPHHHSGGRWRVGPPKHETHHMLAAASMVWLSSQICLLLFTLQKLEVVVFFGLFLVWNFQMLFVEQSIG